ncbi:MAG: 4'-phosphopantetheinyl transferase superfamily protein [Psychrobium sp.]|nr:4'-phosphopantetheinyl transferase superfamily protein [Psychrobium sp.]
MKVIVNEQGYNINYLDKVFILSEKVLFIPNLINIVLYKCVYDNSAFKQNLFESLDIKPALSLSKAIIKRKSEYLAGRYCAKKALEKVNIYNVNIMPDNDRCPLWPSHVLGSITHTKDHAFSAVASKNNYKYLGIDFEEFMSPITATSIYSRIINNAEYCLIAKNNLSFSKAVTLIFSAKESLFKALFPYVGEYFDFTAAQIVNYSCENKSFELILCENLTDQLIKGTSFRGHFEQTNSHILTIIAM